MAMQRWQKLFTELFQQSPLAKKVRDMQTLANFLCVFFYFENVVVSSSVYEACTTEGKLSYHSFFTVRISDSNLCSEGFFKKVILLSVEKLSIVITFLVILFYLLYYWLYLLLSLLVAQGSKIFNFAMQSRGLKP